MLILQVALGIVLAVIILAFLPQLFTAALWIALAVLAVGAIAAAIFTEVGQKIGIGAAVLVGLFWLFVKFNAEVKESKESAVRMANQGAEAPVGTKGQLRHTLLIAAVVIGIVALPFLGIALLVVFKFLGF